MEIVPIDKKQVIKVLDKHGVIAVVGVYGSGKSLICEWLEHEEILAGNIVVRVSFKDLPLPIDKDVSIVLGYKNLLQCHTTWRNLAENQRKGGHCLTIIIEEAQQLRLGGGELWQVLTSLHYYQRQSVRIVLTAQPAIFGIANANLQRLIEGRIRYPRRITSQEVRKYWGNRGYLAAAQRLSCGHWGTLKYLAQLVDRHVYRGKRLSVARVVEWMRGMGQVDYFAQTIWEGLSAIQRGWIRRWVVSRGHLIMPKSVAEELVRVGMLRRGGGRLHWFVPWLLDFVREYLTNHAELSKTIDWSSWGSKERKCIERLQHEKEILVEYNDLIDYVWGVEHEVSMWTLARLVSRVNAKLMESGSNVSIENVRGRGYRWIG